MVRHPSLIPDLTPVPPWPANLHVHQNTHSVILLKFCNSAYYFCKLELEGRYLWGNPEWVFCWLPESPSGSLWPFNMVNLEIHCCFVSRSFMVCTFLTSILRWSVSFVWHLLKLGLKCLTGLTVKQVSLGKV